MCDVLGGSGRENSDASLILFHEKMRENLIVQYNKFTAVVDLESCM